jgi:AraC-like DNA-binding protein
MPQKRTMSPHDQQEIIESELVDFEPQLCSPAYSTRVEQLADYIETHLFESWLNVKTAKQDCEIRSGRIHIRFRQQTGTTIRRIIERERMRAAKRLLKLELLDTCEIAFGIGYDTYSTFRRAFKRRTGLPPSSWRQKENAG